MDETVTTANATGLLARDLRRSISGFVRTVRQDTGTVRSAQSETLDLLHRLGPMNVARLAEQRGVTHQTMRWVVAQLDADGLVQQDADPDDRRSRLVSISPAGTETLALERDARESRIADAIRSLTFHEQDLLRAAIPILDRLAGFNLRRRLTEEVCKAGRPGHQTARNRSENADRIDRSSMKGHLSNPVRNHVLGFIASYFTTIAACAVVLTAMSLGTASFAAGGASLPAHSLTGALTSVLLLFWFGLAATILALPSVIVGYPLAVVTARRLRRPGHTALAGAALGPIVGTAAALCFFSLESGLAPTSWVEQATFLVPTASAAGAAIGWTTGTLESRRQMRAT